GAGASAQLPLPKLSVAGGVSHYDFGTSGTSAIGALRLEVPLVSLVGEGSLALFRPTIDGVARTALIPEAQLQWQFSPVLVRPYIVGVGRRPRRHSVHPAHRARRGAGPHDGIRHLAPRDRAYARRELVVAARGS